MGSRSAAVEYHPSFRFRDHTRMKLANKTDAPNAAIALRFHAERLQRGVGDPGR